MFNPDDFMHTQVEEVTETSFSPIPEGEYPAVIKEVKADTVGENALPVLNITWTVDDEEARQFTGMDEPSVRQTLWLDIDANGMLETGKNKNIQLGRLRDALNQNTGAPWSPSMMEGQVARVHITHTAGKNDAIYANVKGVAKLG